jgi:epoxyqueuosine reductase
MQDSSQQIKKKAEALGFDKCGIKRAEYLQNFDSKLINWLSSGFHADMQYMTNHLEKRVNPSLLVENAKSVIVVLLNYGKRDIVPSNYKIAQYAMAEDYHIHLKKMLSELLAFVKELYPGTQGRVYTDSAPVAERELAVKAGLGWIGKNCNLISRKIGSYTFIGEIIVDVELSYENEQQQEHCGNCIKCIESCPTGALSQYQLDARKCISYQTIENKSSMDNDVRIEQKEWVFGCDICMQACPWNSKLSNSHEMDWLQTTYLAKDLMNGIIPPSEEAFKIAAKRSPIGRISHKKLLDNFNQKS